MVLRLHKPKTDRKVKWEEGVVDNELMGKKKSKCELPYCTPHAHTSWISYPSAHTYPLHITHTHTPHTHTPLTRTHLAHTPHTHTHLTRTHTSHAHTPHTHTPPGSHTPRHTHTHTHKHTHWCIYPLHTTPTHTSTGCCIYNKPHKFGESDSESDPDEDDCCHEHRIARRRVPKQHGSGSRDQTGDT